ncbi:MAG TPA: M20 family metallopeptidase [Chloroflexota bacterium]|nr:M20 family metallopeptidase [Chloroflexota bacterium]
MTSRAEWESRVLAAIDRDELVDVARAAVRVPTVNPPGDERALADQLAARLRAGTIAVELLHHDPARASLVGRVRGRGERPGLILTGHLDVVGPGEQPWRHDPFGGEVVDGRLYGRGSADMKGALAAMVAAALAIARTGAPIGGDLVLGFTAGEETDSFGAQALADAGLLDGADAVVIGEPTDLDVYIAEKGNLWLEITTSGRTAHASMPHLGRNAIYAMADVLEALESYRFPDPPHPLLGSPTLSVGTIRGGVRTNVVPDACAIEVDVRTLPGQSHERVAADVQELLAEVRRRRPELDVRVRLAYGRGAVATPPDAPIVREVVGAVADVVGRAPEPRGVMYATDGAVLVPALGIPMAICGPGPRELAHQTDEHVAVDALVAAARIYALVALRHLGAGGAH